MKIFRRLILGLGLVLLFAIIFLLTTLFIVKHIRIKDLVEHEIEQDLGINVTIEQIHFSPLLAHIVVGGVSIQNPPGFDKGELAYINSMQFMFDPIELLVQRKPNVYFFTIDIKQLNVVRNAQGKINIKELIPTRQEEAVSETKTPFYFDIAVLSIEAVNFIDYKSGNKKVYQYPVNIKNATFFDIKNGSAVVRLIVSEAIKYTTIGKIIPVVSELNSTVSSAWSTTTTGAKSVWQIITLPFNLLTGK